MMPAARFAARMSINFPAEEAVRSDLGQLLPPSDRGHGLAAVGGELVTWPGLRRPALDDG